jgi:hypothetical protein
VGRRRLSCGEDSLDPDAQILYGQWGTPGENPAQLIALNVAAELRLACSSVVTSSPVPLRPDNSFEFIGRYVLQRGVDPRFEDLPPTCPL